MAQSRDLHFLARRWETVELPKDKKYLLRYFRTPLQVAFIKYVYIFGDADNFADHTGLACSPRWCIRLFDRMKRLEVLKQEARFSMDMTALAHIESGKFKLEMVKSSTTPSE